MAFASALVAPPLPVDPVASPDGARGADLFNYLLQNGPGFGSVDGLTAAEQAGRMANPATLGNQIFSGLDGFNKRAQRTEDMVQATIDGKTAAAPSAGPAAAPLRPAANSANSYAAQAPASGRAPGGSSDSTDLLRLSDSEFRAQIGSLNEVFRFAIETQLVMGGAQQSVNATQTLLRGQ
jgi:hypothetical protein